MSPQVLQVTVLRKFVDCSAGRGDLTRPGVGETDWSLGSPSWPEIMGQRTKEERATHSQRKNDF